MYRKWEDVVVIIFVSEKLVVRGIAVLEGLWFLYRFCLEIDY